MRIIMEYLTNDSVKTDRKQAQKRFRIISLLQNLNRLLFLEFLP